MRTIECLLGAHIRNELCLLSVQQPSHSQVKPRNSVLVYNQTVYYPKSLLWSPSWAHDFTNTLDCAKNDLGGSRDTPDHKPMLQTRRNS